ncbi:MAG: DUF4837 family protein [Chlorobi bacterium]|nr:DUF4837 family protein [Chlorobiota bacterium]
MRIFTGFVRKGMFICSLFFLLIVSGCKSGMETMKPMVSGAAGEVLLVMPDAQWERPAGEKFKALLTQEIPYLPQPEPMFTLIHVSPANFDKMFFSHRNIIIVKTGSQYKEARLVIKKDQWAAPQIVIDVEAPSDSTLVQLLNVRGSALVDKINQAERDRILSNYRSYIEAPIYQTLKSKYHLTLAIPKGYSLDVDSVDFAWIASETPATSQGILIYTYPYTDEIELAPGNLIKTRNRFLKKYVHGPVEGTFMSTETLLPPLFHEFTLNGEYVAEMKGLWKLENGFMGGPFVSFTTIDKYRNRVVTVEGFVYAPSEKKRELFRQVESILYSLKIVPPETEKK